MRRRISAVSRLTGGFIIFTASILFPPCSFAQVHDDQPTLMDAVLAQTTTTITTPEAVSTNDVLVVCTKQTTGGGSPPYTVSDSLGNTWNTTTAQLTSTGLCCSPATALQIAWTQSGSSGADTITIGTNPSSSPRSTYARFKNVSATQDGSTAGAATGFAGSGVNTLTVTNTTTTNGSLIVACGIGADGGGGGSWRTGGYELSQEAASWDNLSMTFQNTGAAGNYSTTYELNQVTESAMQAIALKPTTIAVVTTALHDAGVGTAYSDTLKAVGGTAAYTYSIFSGALPTGLSLNTGTGAITGTPSGSPGVSTIGFRVTDGTLTSSTKTLTITVGAALNTPVIRQTITFSADGAGTIDTGPTVTGARCGDIFLIGVEGDDTHGSQGWVQAVSGTNNYLKDSFNSPVQRVNGITGVWVGPLVWYVIGPLTQSGSDVIKFRNNQGATSGLSNGVLFDVAGVQSIANIAAINSITTQTGGSGTSGTISNSFVTTVPNVQLFLGLNTQRPDDTYSLPSPFSVYSSGNGAFNSWAYGSALISSASTVSGTSTISLHSGSATTFDWWDSSMVGLYPSILNGIAQCSAFTGQGEKLRRQVW